MNTPYFNSSSSSACLQQTIHPRVEATAISAGTEAKTGIRALAGRPSDQTDRVVTTAAANAHAQVDQGAETQTSRPSPSRRLAGAAGQFDQGKTGNPSMCVSSSPVRSLKVNSSA